MWLWSIDSRRLYSDTQARKRKGNSMRSFVSLFLVSTFVCGSQRFYEYTMQNAIFVRKRRRKLGKTAKSIFVKTVFAA